MTEVTEHELYDFSQLPLTNEQQILATLLRIEALLTPTQGVPGVPQVTKATTRDEQIASLAATNAAKVAPKGGRFGRK